MAASVVLVVPRRLGTIIAGAAPNLRRSIGTNKPSTSAAGDRPLPRTAPHKLLAQVEHPAGRSHMLVAVHGLALRSASDAIRAPLTELLKPYGCRAPPRARIAPPAPAIISTSRARVARRCARNSPAINRRPRTSLRRRPPTSSSAQSPELHRSPPTAITKMESAPAAEAAGVVRRIHQKQQPPAGPDAQPQFSGLPPMGKVRPENQSEHTPVRRGSAMDTLPSEQ